MATSLLIASCVLFVAHCCQPVHGQVIGSTAVLLDNSTCRQGECNMANFINDAMVDEMVKKAEAGSWSYSSIAVSNAGSFSAGLSETPTGTITYQSLNLVQPWNNTFDTSELEGRRLLEALEQSATKWGTSGVLHWSGLRVIYDMSRPVNSRVVEARVLCRACRVPEYARIDPNAWYRVNMHSYLLMEADDGYTLFRDYHRNRVVGRGDMDVVADYLKRKSPITQGLDGRMIRLDSGTLKKQPFSKRIQY